MPAPSTFTPRPKQLQILEYSGGTMGIAAVPGSGKTWTLSWLAAGLIQRSHLLEDQEILIVTLVNSAVDNFSRRVGGFIEKSGLLPVGYRVRTLHALAYEIVRERPDLVYLPENFEIADERAADEILTSVVEAWLRSHPNYLDEYLLPDLEDNESKREWVKRDKFPRMIHSLASNFIHFAKDQELTPEDLERKLSDIPNLLPLAEMGREIYAGYQRGLNYRGALDYDDLIRLALAALHADNAYLARLQNRWPFILEDESQDSSRLQQEILQTIAGPEGNWVRVGDPNQAIFETFTTASPQFLRDFIQYAEHSRDLPNSGRSTQGIIDLANYLIDWTIEEHPVEAVRDALSRPHILPTPPGDPQPNPPDEDTFIYIEPDGHTPDQEIQMVATSLERWLPENEDVTVAVLVPTNTLGFKVATELRNRDIEPLDTLLRSTNQTRRTTGALANILNFLQDTKSSRLLAILYQVWRRAERKDEDKAAEIDRAVELLKKCRNTEEFLAPRLESDWLESQDISDSEPEIFASLSAFREIIQRWQGAILLPIDQLILTLAQDIFIEPADLALAHKLAVILGQANDNHPDWHLPEFTEELTTVAKNERRFIGFSEDDRAFDPEMHRGRVVISTMHKAKGLEWDRVYMMSVNNFSFPSGQEYDKYMGEDWFIRDQLNLGAETLGQLEALLSIDDYDWYEEGQATQDARLDYVEERLRLLFVGITRAKKELIITWNTGNRDNNQASIPLVALRTYLEEHKPNAA